MASITSVISFFALLAVYCYSAPIEPKRDISKSGFDYTTGSSIIHNDQRVTLELISDEEATHPSIEHAARTSENENLEFTTSGVHQTRLNSEHEIKGSSTVPPQSKRGLNDFRFTTMETSTEFESRVIKPEGGQPGVESSSFGTRGLPEDVTESSSFGTRGLSEDVTESSSIGTRGLPEDVTESSSVGTRGLSEDVTESSSVGTRGLSEDVTESSSVGTHGLSGERSGLESSTNFQGTSSVETFGKYTGLLKGEQPKGKPSEGKEGEPKPIGDKKPHTNDDSSQTEDEKSPVSEKTKSHN